MGLGDFEMDLDRLLERLSDDLFRIGDLDCLRIGDLECLRIGDRDLLFVSPLSISASNLHLSLSTASMIFRRSSS